MKNLIILSVFALVLFGCNKVTESNIIGVWNVSELNVNGVDQTLTGTEKMEFQDGGIILVWENGVSDAGTYSLNQSDQIITITFDGETTEMTITEKKGKKMTINYTVDGVTFIVKLEKQ